VSDKRPPTQPMAPPTRANTQPMAPPTRANTQNVSPETMPSRIDAVEAGDESAALMPAWNLVNHLHMLMKAALLHDAQHSVAQGAAHGLAKAVAVMSPPFTIQFVAGGVFVDRTLVPLDFNHFERCVQLTNALNRLNSTSASRSASRKRSQPARVDRPKI